MSYAIGNGQNPIKKKQLICKKSGLPGLATGKTGSLDNREKSPDQQRPSGLKTVEKRLFDFLLKCSVKIS
jgi:hypothetical protein